MIREERLELLKQIEKDIHVCSLESTLLDDAKSCAIHSVIEELEQEPFINKPCVSSEVCEHDKQKVLNKIIAEIEQITDTMGVSYNQYVSKIDVLKIIDRYKGESEKV